MTDDMVERAARALYEDDAKVSSVRWHPWKIAKGTKQLRYRQRARAAIAAMQEPTEAMLFRGNRASGEPQPESGTRYQPVFTTRDQWRAMIDQALSE